MADEKQVAAKSQARRYAQLIEVMGQTYDRTATLQMQQRSINNMNLGQVAYTMRNVLLYGEVLSYGADEDGRYRECQPVRNVRKSGLDNKTFAIAKENKRLIEYGDPKTNRLRVVKPAAFAKMVNRKLEIGFDDELIDRYATYLGEEMPNATPYEYEILGGRDITRIYNATSRTCMTGSVSLQFYENNDPFVQIVHIKRRNETFGRAILWTLHDGRKYLDRIYPSSGTHIADLIDHAGTQGWLVRPTHGAEVRQPEREALDNEKAITVPLNPPNDNSRSAHSMGGFPYLDTFRYMKHSPDKTSVMLRPNYKRGWVTVGDSRHMYQGLEYCPLMRGWSDSLVTAFVADDELNLLEERRFDGPHLRRTHQLVRFPKEEGRPGVYRVFVSESLANEIVTDHLGAKFLRRHGIEMPDGKLLFRDDALEMHDGTYIEAQGQLRYVARLPNGKFIFRRDARYDQERREWVPKEG